jgi:protoheme ferro-lyase
MSDTPETDAAWDKYISHPYTYGAGDLRILAQRLERERDEAIELLKIASWYSTTTTQEMTEKFLRKIGKWEDAK